MNMNSTHNYSILLVEDEPELRKLIYEVLTDAGYTVLKAGSGQAALNLSASHTGSIHLLLTDVVMPGGFSGPQLARRLAPLQPGMKILYISGYTDDLLSRHDLQTGDAAFLPKPFNPAQLLKEVRRILNS